VIAAYRRAMDEGISPVQTVHTDSERVRAARWAKYSADVAWDAPVNTALSRERLQFLAERLTHVPANFTLHSRVEKVIADRRAMGRGELALDWGMAENLAYAAC